MNRSSGAQFGHPFHGFSDKVARQEGFSFAALAETEDRFRRGEMMLAQLYDLVNRGTKVEAFLRRRR